MFVQPLLSLCSALMPAATPVPSRLLATRPSRSALCCPTNPPHPALPCSIHPGPSGHQVLAELLAGLITKAAQEVAAGATSAPAPRPGQEGLPPPMVKNFRESRTSVCAQLVGAHRLPMCLSAKCMLPVGMSSALPLRLPGLSRAAPQCRLHINTHALLQRDFEPAVVQQDGFDYGAEKPDLPSWVEQKWGWRSREPGGEPWGGGGTCLGAMAGCHCCRYQHGCVCFATVHAQSGVAWQLVVC